MHGRDCASEMPSFPCEQGQTFVSSRSESSTKVGITGGPVNVQRNRERLGRVSVSGARGTASCSGSGRPSEARGVGEVPWSPLLGSD